MFRALAVVITCGTGPAGTEIRLWSCRRTPPRWTWNQAALAGEVPEKWKVGDTTGVNKAITVQIIISSLSLSLATSFLVKKLFFLMVCPQWATFTQQHEQWHRWGSEDDERGEKNHTQNFGILMCAAQEAHWTHCKKNATNALRN